MSDERPQDADEARLLDEVVERAVAPYRGKLPDRELAALEVELRLGLLAHPSSRALIRRLRARAPSHSSGVDPDAPALQRGDVARTGTKR